MYDAKPKPSQEGSSTDKILKGNKKGAKDVKPKPAQAGSSTDKHLKESGLKATGKKLPAPPFKGTVGLAKQKPEKKEKLPKEEKGEVKPKRAPKPKGPSPLEVAAAAAAVRARNNSPPRS